MNIMQYLADGMFNHNTRRSLQWKYRNARLGVQDYLHSERRFTREVTPKATAHKTKRVSNQAAITEIQRPRYTKQ